MELVQVTKLAAIQTIIRLILVVAAATSELATAQHVLNIFPVVVAAQVKSVPVALV